MLIEGQDLTVTIDDRAIIQGESVRCAPGRMTTLVGPSGSGKTTLLHTHARPPTHPQQRQGHYRRA